MHPIERLRYVAAVSPEQPAVLAREAAAALLGCADPAELVVACRRLLDRQPAVGPLWWVASVAVIASDPRTALLDAIDALETDPTPAHVSAALTESPDHHMVDVLALGRTGALVGRRAAGQAGATSDRNAPVWAVGGIGRTLPDRVWEAALARVERAGRRVGAVLYPPETFSLVAGPEGLTPFADALATADCPLAPELLVTPR